MRNLTKLALQVVFATIFSLTLVTGVLAQSEPLGFNSQEWETTASRAEEIIDNGAASSPALEALRLTLTDWRAEALAQQDSNRERAETLAAQIAALGPVPADAETEPPEIADRRESLAAQLAAAKAPVLAAEEAYQRADGMIGEIDSIIRERQADQLLQLDHSPLQPALWLGAISALGEILSDVRDEVEEALNSDAQRAMARQNLPLTAFLLIAGIVLIIRSNRWMEKAFNLSGLQSRSHGGLYGLVLPVVSQVGLPMLGLLGVIKGIETTGMINLRGQVLMGAAPYVGLAIFGGRWLGRCAFVTVAEMQPLLSVPREDADRGHRLTMLMGVVMALYLLLSAIARQGDFPRDAQIVLAFPLVLIGGVLLFRMGQLLERYRAARLASEIERPLQNRVLQLIARAALLIGFVGPVLAAVGYFGAAVNSVFPAILSLALFGTLAYLFRLLTQMSLLLTDVGLGPRSDDETSAAPYRLLPVLLGFALIIAATPLFALIWGARVSDLTEVWSVISQGVTLGDRRFSVKDLLTFVVVFSVGYTLTRLLQSTFRTTVLPNTKLDTGGRNAVLTGTGYVGIFLSALAAITSAGLDLSSLAIVAGALSVGIGFGLQAIVSNFVSGIILLVERPIKEGDWIEVSGNSGYVRKISVRSTEIATFDRATVIVPNADLISSAVTNWTHSTMSGRVKVPVGVAYGSDPRQVEAILMDIAESHSMVLKNPAPNVVFLGFGADSMDFEIRAILRDVNWMLTAKSDMNFEIVKRFDEAGIEIPFAQRDLTLRNADEVAAALGKVMNPKRK